MKIKSAQSGFTLVEMIVSLAIFSIVAVVAVGALLKITDANRKAQTLQVAINNVNFAFESMTREMRVGSAYQCVVSGPFQGSSVSAASCDGMDNGNDPSGSSIAFASSNRSPDGLCNLTYSYFIAPTSTVGWTIQKASQSRCTDSISSSGYAPVMDPSVVITGYNFGVVSPDASHASYAPKIFVHIVGYAGTPDRQRTYFNLQTTVSERI